ncbi:hydroxypyruvate isomerase family protein [Aestuariirhabdus sp. LZHN29]|uniref:hydroxypyruvate isomerase family protein n=1 Tax=Aestuariirhabdus sp. LZHN29 TaxID=3417462 RepID=UPI003CED5CDE
MPTFCANISLLYTEVPLEARLKLARADGFDGFEVQFPYAIDALAWRQQMDELGMTCVLFNVDAGDLLQGGEGVASVPGRREQFRFAVEQALGYAHLLAPSVINVLPGRCVKPEDRDIYIQTLVDNLAYAAAQFYPLGITTCVEAINTTDMPDFLIHTTEQMVEVLTRLDHPGVKMQYDLYHMATMNQSIREDLRHYAGQIGHIQFADLPGRGEPGSGTLDLCAYFSQIDRCGYEGWVGAEYRPTRETSKTLEWMQP